MKQLKLSEYIDLLKSDKPTPGGGSSLALVAANGISLMMMAANVTILKLSKKQLQCEALEQAVEKLQPLLDVALELIEKDGFAFQNILTAMKMPKDDEKSYKIRQQTLQNAYIESAEVCLSLMEISVDAIKLSAPVIELSDQFVVSDALIGLNILTCVTKSQRHNVEINVNCISNEETREKLTAKMHKLLEVVA